MISLKVSQVVYQTLVASEEGSRQRRCSIHLITMPATILRDQMHRTVKVGNGHQGFNAIFVTFLKEVLIELETCFIWPLSSSLFGKIRDQAMDKLVLKPISPKREQHLL